MKIGATLIPLAGWAANLEEPAKERERRLSALRRLIEEYGLKAVELTLDFGLLYPQVMDGVFYHQAAHLQEELGFACTVHLPLLWLDLSSLNEPIRQTSGVRPLGSGAGTALAGRELCAAPVGLYHCPGPPCSG